MIFLFPAFTLADEPAEEVRATPYRPTISNPAELPVPGWVETELGWQLTHGGENKDRHSMPYLLKFAMNEDWGVLVGGDGYVNQVETKQSILTEGFGNVALFLKRRAALTETSVFGLEVGAAHQTLDGGQFDYIANAIFSQDIGLFRLDTNVSATYLGGTEPGEDRWVVGWASALGFPIADQWGGAIEFSGFHRSGTPEFAQFLATVNYTYHPRVVFDAGAATGIMNSSYDWTVFAGVTVLLFQVF
jgi:hypothetical protein